MTVASRLEKIEAMLSEDPQDNFLRYRCALELAKVGRNKESLDALDGLMEQPTPYVPAFFMAAQQLARLDRVDDARTCLKSGIDRACRQGDTHAAAEMSDYLVGLGE
jgi:predicted Zn-dependent protease